jgi:hypothetical protein
MAKEHEMATSVVHQTKEDQTHSSMMAWRVHEHRFLQGNPRVGLGKLIVLHGSERSFLQFGERS